MVGMSLLVNLVSLAVISYLTAYTVDKVGGFETSMDAFLLGGSDTSWADVVNKQLRTDYTSLFREVSPGLTRLATALQNSQNTAMQDVAAFASTAASISDMMMQLDSVSSSTGGKPEGGAEIGGALFGDILGLKGGADSKMVKFLEAQGELKPLKDLGTTCKAWIKSVQMRSWEYTRTYMKDWQYTGTCKPEGNMFSCTEVKTITRDVYDLASEVERVCESLERLVA